jgi:hypothetical protein
MKRWIAVWVAAIVLAGAGQAFAQENRPGAGTVVVTIIPGGATFFTSGSSTSEASFVNYGLGTAAEVYFNRFVGVEGELTGVLGVTQDLQFAAGTANQKTPNLINYNGNVVVSMGGSGHVVPYLTGGIGGLTVTDRPALGVNDTTTFLTGNAGGGLKWFSSNYRWGVRGDYRFLAVQSKDDAPAFFGQETRYGHRVYGAVLVKVGR